MSLAILLGGWVAVSVILSPVIGRFLAGPSKNRIAPHPQADGSSVATFARPRHAESMRRNVAIQLYRRDAGWPRAS
jgi:hypothetical protein